MKVISDWEIFALFVVINCISILVIEDKIPGNTGFFEVELENGEVLHSKKNGDGYVDTPNKLEKIMSGVENALKWYYWNNEYFLNSYIYV